MRTPAPIYESLPALYVIAGVMAVAILGSHPLVLISSSLLFVAAAMTYFLRRAHRLTRTRSSPRRGGRATTRPSTR
jgi:hypothetical protein